MKVWMLFLLGAFVVGAVTAQRGARERTWPLLVACALVAAALYSRRFA